MVHRQAALPHHLFQIPVAQLIPAVPADAQQDKGWLEVTPLEGGFGLFQDNDSRRV